MDLGVDTLTEVNLGIAFQNYCKDNTVDDWCKYYKPPYVPWHPSISGEKILLLHVIYIIYCHMPPPQGLQVTVA